MTVYKAIAFAGLALISLGLHFSGLGISDPSFWMICLGFGLHAGFRK
jgi:hypothetical protein